MNLYEINAELLSCIDTETGEVIDIEKLNSLNMQMQDKIENIGCWVKNLLSNADQLDAEIKSLTERKKSAKNKAESLKKYLSDFLNGSKFESSKVSIFYRKSESVEVMDIEQIKLLENCDDYLTYKEPEANKTAIKDAIKHGVIVPGCSLVEKQNIQIK